MQWAEFAHAVRAAGEILGEDTVVVIGGQSIVPCSTTTAMNGVTALCMESHDLCVAKPLAVREMDTAFVLALLSAGLVDRGTILARLEDMDVDAGVRRRARASLQQDPSR